MNKTEAKEKAKIILSNILVDFMGEDWNDKYDQGSIGSTILGDMPKKDTRLVHDQMEKLALKLLKKL